MSGLGTGSAGTSTAWPFAALQTPWAAVGVCVCVCVCVGVCMGVKSEREGKQQRGKVDNRVENACVKSSNAKSMAHMRHFVGHSLQ